MMEQLSLNSNMNVATLPNGQQIKEGDIIWCTISMYEWATRVILKDGSLCLEESFMHGNGYSLANFVNYSYQTVIKITLADVYRKCKQNNWDTGRYIRKFSHTSK